MTKAYSSHRFISNCFNAGNLKMEVKGEIVRYMKSIGHSIEISLSPQEANWAIGRPKAMMSSILAHLGRPKCSIFMPFITPNLSCVCKITSSSDSLREEIDIFTGTDDLMPPGIKSDDYDSEGEIYFLEELLNNDSILLPKNKLSNFDHHDELSFPRPPLEPPNVEVFFDFEFDSGELIPAVMNNIDELIEDECFDLEGGVKTPFLTPASPLRAGGISSRWNFHML
nr:hypothetical protein [Tanacetum cinerariifolium]